MPYFIAYKNSVNFCLNLSIQQNIKKSVKLLEY